MVEKIFRLAQVGDERSGPMGVKAIASHLNERGYRTRAGNNWHVGPLHALLINPIYKGSYIYNQTGSRTRKMRPAAEHVEVACPAIVDPSDWNAVRALLRSRNPKMAPPRTVSGPILLTGLLRCADCGGAMTIRTGKSGQYRYYTCATQQARGKAACPGRSIRMEKLDEAVTSTLVERLFEPSRLAAMIRKIDERRSKNLAIGHDELIRIEADLTDATNRLRRLYDAIERGIIDIAESDVVDRIKAAKSDRMIANVAKERVLARIGAKADLSFERIVALANLMSDRIANGAVPFRKSYIRASVERIVLSDDTAVIYGGNEALRNHLANVESLGEKVPSSVQEWRTRQDSNL